MHKTTSLLDTIKDSNVPVLEDNLKMIISPPRKLTAEMILKRDLLLSNPDNFPTDPNKTYQVYEDSINLNVPQSGSRKRKNTCLEDIHESPKSSKSSLHRSKRLEVPSDSDQFLKAIEQNVNIIASTPPANGLLGRSQPLIPSYQAKKYIRVRMEISQKKAEEHRDEPIIVDSPQAIMANCIEKVGTLKEVQNDAIVQGWDDSFDEELVICGTLEKEDNATEASLELRLGNGVQENSKAQKVCDNFKEELIYPDLVKENIITTEENSETKKLDDSFEEELIYSDLTKEVENIIPAQKLDDSFEEELIYPKLPKELEDNTKVQEKSIAVPEKNVIVQEDIPIQKPSANITPIKIEEPVVGNEPVKETTDDSVKCRVIKGISKMPLQQDDIDDDFYDDDFYIPPHIEPVIPCVVEKKPIPNLFPHSQTTPRRISTLIPRNTDSSRRLSQLRSRHIFGSYQNHLAPSEGSTGTGNITPNRNTQLLLTKTTPNKRMLKDVAFSPNCYLFRDAPRDDHFNDDYNEDL